MARNSSSQWGKKPGQPAGFGRIVRKKPRVARKLTTTQKAQQVYGKAKAEADDAAVNLERILAVVEPMLAQEGYRVGSLPPDICVRLMLDGREMEGRWAKRYIDAVDRLELSRRRERETLSALLRVGERPQPQPKPEPVEYRPTPSKHWVGRGVVPGNPPTWHRTVPPWEDGPRLSTDR